MLDPPKLRRACIPTVRTMIQGWKSETTQSIEAETPRLLASKSDLTFTALILPPLPLNQPLNLNS